MRTAIVFLLLGGLLSAQYPVEATALRWTGATGSAGPTCWGFSCTPERASVSPGESGSLLVRGELGQVYFLGLSGSASRCLALPLGFHALVLDDPITVIQVGVCARPSGILACPSGMDTIDVRLPPGLTSGTSFSLQALVGVPSGPGMPRWSFSQTITLTVL